MGDTYCKYETGPPVTCHAAAALTGGRMVRQIGEPTGGNPTVNVPAAGGETFGVLARDVASGGKQTVFTGDNLVFIEVAAAGALAANDLIQTDVAGCAIAHAAGICQGKVIKGAAAGAMALVEYRPRKV